MHTLLHRLVTLRCLVCALIPLVAGCLVGPDFHAPNPNMPGAWDGISAGMPTTAPATQGSVATSQPTTIARWWTTFNDPVLDSLVARAVESNLDLRQAEARLRQARAARGVAGAGLWPNVNVSGAYTRSGTGPGDRNTIGGGSNEQDLYRAGFDAAWELDVFGGVRRDIEAASADIAAAVADRQDVLVSVLAEVALDYLDLRGTQREIAISKRNLESQQKTLDITRRVFNVGLQRTRLDVVQAEAQVATTLSQIPPLEASARQTTYALSVLLGREPATLAAELDSEGPIPETPPTVPVGLPSELLRRRPDIRRAEARLHAATARVGVATSDLFPKFSLTGSLGLTGEKPKALVNWDNRFWSVGPSVSWPIFDAGRIRSNIAVQNAVQEEALAAYEQTVLIALRDVESALVAYAKEQQHRSALSAAVEANRAAVGLSVQLWQGGQTDFLNVTTAQRALYASEDALVRSEQLVAQNLVSLYKALGGGWEELDQAAPPQQPAPKP
jgi:NodT family efflux transporter outer membrane factor (OMF) lipoprotein